MMTNVLLLGANGQLGFELQRSKPTNAKLIALTRAEFDLADPSHIRSAHMEKLITSHQPDIVINASAYTAVDKAEEESDLAFTVNAEAVKDLAITCSEQHIQLIHISTDFVFDGQSSQPYKTTDTMAPQNVYGHSKAEGERMLFQSTPQATCVRTSWVYSSHGNNFVKTMLRLMNERDSISVVADQIGSPTWANDLANMLWHIAPMDMPGYLHWSNQGIASWYDFANAIYLLGRQRGLLNNACEIQPISTAEYPTPAKRPAYSLLDKRETIEKIKRVPAHWLAALNKMLQELVVEQP